ncbi:hypothetical protein [Actinoplanes awajinensis]|uniref:Knr4/Smi1-like domain-containing protein n=1 Tax=Actinoplanes awajinensis subsp. mycoplanecinus TaxID=135947 RepID=A0A101JPY2_9ACTN|nr:hypothetical protein [Actinoplanes awajinensis]KUL30825.1 hypothetical protein ADL15_22940 [Actinoplanes awajinensis subsp. mycoplanecinus]
MALQPADLTGYVTRDLDADLARWLAGEPRVTLPAAVALVTPFLSLLPASDAAALAGFDSRVRSGALPQFLDVYDWSYGFDFAANDCAVHNAEQVWSLGADGGGNLYCVLPDGEIGIWFHEEELIEDGTRFDNLDVFLWSAVRYRAIQLGVLALADVRDDFVSLGQGGVLHPELGLIHSLT